MIKIIRLNNYFFYNITDYDPTEHEIGSTRRMPYGKLKTYHSVKYFTFDIQLEQLSPTQLGQFFYLNYLCKPNDDSESENLDFWSDDGEALGIEYPIKVFIPIDGFEFDRESGEEETYSVDLRLEEVLEG